ncbi:MAG: NUDIX hydrolase [Phycisphaerae bacterium]
MNRVLLSAKVFSVERREYPQPNGATICRDVVVHPGAVTILPLLDEHRLVMIRNRRHVVECDLLELPAGTLEPPETPAQCAGRELQEETGYQAETITPLCEFFTTPGICTERMWSFTARNLTQTQQRLEADEHIEVCLLDIQQVRTMMKQGQIQDGKTLAVLGTFFLRAQDA